MGTKTTKAAGAKTGKKAGRTAKPSAADAAMPVTSANDAATSAEAGPEPAAPATVAKGRARKAKAAQPAKEKKLSALDAAAQVLADYPTPMNCTEMIQVMAERGLWSSPAGKTPAATLYSAILREVTTKGAAARFRKAERGRFERTSA